jgi:hypothetical protein
MSHEAIRALHKNVVTIRGDVAYDANENIVEYDKDTVAKKHEELLIARADRLKTIKTAKQSGLAKLTALGLTADELEALGALK